MFALLTSLAVVVFLARGLIGLSTSSMLLFVLVLAGVMSLLVRVALLSDNKKYWTKRQLIVIRAHIFFHLVPFSYLALHLEVRPSLSMNLLYYLPIMVFFYTGRRTWQSFFTAFGSKVYKLFYLGNTGMMLSLSAVLVLGLLTEEAVITAFFHALFTLYFSVHLLIVGAVVIKIESDLRGK